MFFVLVAASVHKAGLCVRHRELPLQQTGLLLIAQLWSRADSLQAILAAGRAVHAERVSSAKARTLQAFPALRGRERSESEDRLSEARVQKGHELQTMIRYLLVFWVTMCRGGAALVLFVNRVASLDVFRQVTFTAEVRRRVVRRLPETDLDVLAGRGEQVAQDLQKEEPSQSVS